MDKKELKKFLRQVKRNKDIVNICTAAAIIGTVFCFELHKANQQKKSLSGTVTGKIRKRVMFDNGVKTYYFIIKGIAYEVLRDDYILFKKKDKVTLQKYVGNHTHYKVVKYKGKPVQILPIQ